MVQKCVPKLRTCQARPSSIFFPQSMSKEREKERPLWAFIDRQEKEIRFSNSSQRGPAIDIQFVAFWKNKVLAHLEKSLFEQGRAKNMGDRQFLTPICD
uniref:Uncharacterized protein n=1 Tax=Romanomermis culicivorax TaxID=13658 RepID=A0A915IMF3_ROMCU